jgi:hypothetical protein
VMYERKWALDSRAVQIPVRPDRRCALLCFSWEQLCRSPMCCRRPSTSRTDRFPRQCATATPRTALLSLSLPPSLFFCLSSLLAHNLSDLLKWKRIHLRTREPDGPIYSHHLSQSLHLFLLYLYY